MIYNFSNQNSEVIMFRLSHTALITLSGLVWLAIGCFLLPLGLNFIVASILKENISQARPILDTLASLTDGLEPAALILIAFSLLLGYFKGRFVFKKTVDSSVTRILTMPNPAPLHHLYTM